MRTNRKLIVVCIIALFCLIVGGGFVLVGQALGGRGKFSGINKWGVNLGPISIGSKRYNGPFDNKTIMLDEFESFEIDLAMIQVEIENGSEASLELIDIPSGTLQTSQNESTLRIHNDYDDDFNYDLGNFTNKVILTLPEKEFTNVDIVLSMGTLKIGALQAKNVKVKGSMTEIDIINLTSEGLDIESSMADVDVNGKLTGVTTIESSMGNVDVTILGNPNEFQYNLTNSMGSIKYDGRSLDGLSSNASGNASAANKIVIDNSMGNIDVRFR